MSRRFRLALVGVAAVALWISLLRFPNLVPGVTLDDGWMAALGHLFKRDSRARVDYVFTYGPLGFFMLRAYDADLFAARFVWELVIKALFTVIAFWFLSRQRGAIARGLFYVTLLSYPAVSDDAMYALMLLLLAVLMLTRPDAPLRRVGGVALLLVILALMKFSLFLIGCAVAVCLVVHLVAGGRTRAALVAAGTFILGFVVLWTLAGQSPSGFPVFLRGSAEISGGFSEAMSLEGSPLEVALGALVLALFASTWIAFRGWRFDGHVGVLNALVLGVVLFLFWKQGFARHDVHPVHFFALTLPLSFLPPLALAGFDWRARWRPLLLLAAGLVSAGGMVKVTHSNGLDPWPAPWHNVSEGLSGLFNPRGLRLRLEAQRVALREQYDLPRLRAIVGDAPMDVLGNHQGIALLNGMNWRPRPAFQSYVAYTDWLAERNAAFLDGQEAPHYVLLGGSTIDERFPTIEDGPALLRVLADYRPIAAEKGLLLLKREASAPPSVTGTRRSVLRLGEILRLDPSDRPDVLRLRFQKSWWGAIRGFLFKIPPVFLTVQTTDGATGTFRVLSSLKRSGFLLNPPLRHPADWIDVYAGDAGGPRIAALRIDAPSSGSCFRTVDVALDTLSSPTSIRIDPVAASGLRSQLAESP